MFGRGRFQNGVLIEPKPQFAFDPSDAKKLEEFRNAIWYESSGCFVKTKLDYPQAHSGENERLRTSTFQIIQRGIQRGYSCREGD